MQLYHKYTVLALGLRDKYDKFYHSPHKKKELKDVILDGWPRNRVEAILYSAERGDTVMDVGCGNGHLLYQLRHKYKSLVGIEYSPSRLEQAKANLSNLPFLPVLGSAEHMSVIESNSIDCIVLFKLLHKTRKRESIKQT